MLCSNRKSTNQNHEKAIANRINIIFSLSCYSSACKDKSFSVCCCIWHRVYVWCDVMWMHKMGSPLQLVCCNNQRLNGHHPHHTKVKIKPKGKKISPPYSDYYIICGQPRSLMRFVMSQNKNNLTHENRIKNEWRA